MAAIDLESRGPECVSQHRSAVFWLRFGNEEGRRLRRPRYRGEQSHLLDIGEAPGGASGPIQAFRGRMIKERTFRRCSDSKGESPKFRTGRLRS